MRVLLIIAGLVFASGSLQAQTIRGLVLDSESKSPVAYASVALHQLPDSVLITGVITLGDGHFTLSPVKPGDYLVRVSYLGYKPGQARVSMVQGQQLVEMDTLFLSTSSQAIDEVTITGDRLNGKELVDRTVYSIPPLAAQSSANGYELLKKIPQVQVDFQNNITLNGSSNFIIQVDGKQRDRDFLAKLLPTDIETIEIITNPSGRYEGNIDGVLNIILKKEARFGLSGNTGAHVKPFNKLTGMANGSLDYGMGKTTVYITAFGFMQRLDVHNSALDRYLANDSVHDMKGNGDLQVSSTSVNTGLDYYINDKNNISFNVNIKPINQHISTGGRAGLTRGDFLLNFLNTINDNETGSLEGSGSVFYKRSFSRAIQEFTSETSYYRFSSTERTRFENRFFLPDWQFTGDSTFRAEDNINQRGYFSQKLDYVHPLGLNARLEGGYQFYVQQMQFDLSGTDIAGGDLFRYEEWRNALYGGLTINLDKLGIQATLRTEHSLNRVNQVESSKYFTFLPSTNIQYKFTSKQNLKFTYNRRINRPGVYDLNPFRRTSANYNFSEGNPGLRPEYRDRLQLTYTWNFGRNYLAPYLYHELYSNKIDRRAIVIESPLLEGMTSVLTRPDNLLTGYESGAGLNAMLWFVNVNARYFKGHINEFTGQLPLIPARDYSSYSINGYMFGQYPKKWKLTGFLFVNFNGVTINSQSKTYRMPFYGFGAQKQAGDHTFGLFYLLPFSTKVEFTRTITETPYYTSDNRMGFDVSYFVQFMYAYKFSKGRTVKKLNRKVEIESDSKQEGIGR